MTLHYNCVKFFILLLLGQIASAISFSGGVDYNHSVSLNSAYNVHWNIDGDEIELALEVKTTGWVHIVL